MPQVGMGKGEEGKGERTGRKGGDAGSAIKGKGVHKDRIMPQGDPLNIKRVYNINVWGRG